MTIASGAFQQFAGLWERAFRNFGTTPHQSPGCILAEGLRQDASAPVVVRAGGALTAFRRNGQLAYCLVEGSGALVTGEAQFSPRVLLDTARELMNVQAIYLPLLYPDTSTAHALLQVKDTSQLKRRSSPIITQPFDPATIQARCEERLGSRYRRRLRRFENARLVFTGLTGFEAIKALDAIERRSWKAACGQDMHSRGQFDGYANRLATGELGLSVVLADSIPIAYRLDTKIGGTMFVLKWSFDESWRYVSPGFALLVVDLPAKCIDANADLVDLFGSPDQLKDSLSTGVRRRVDMVWPEGPLARQILEERRIHDIRNEAAYARGESIRTAYASGN